MNDSVAVAYGKTTGRRTLPRPYDAYPDPYNYSTVPILKPFLKKIECRRRTTTVSLYSKHYLTKLTKEDIVYSHWDSC
ncbi:hypothetical protein Trydic_g7635 [Trypoxylus dichotomus]